MLKSLDILLGIAVVMLVASMAVTVLTQIWTTLFNTRGVHLRDGLASLLRQLHSSLTPADAQAIAAHVLTHPLIRDSTKCLGSIIHRDELTRLLLETAAGEGNHQLTEVAKQALLRALQENGVSDPAETLAAIRNAALALEAASPHLAAAARQDLAILKVSAGEFTAKINGWFDRTVDRVSARFTATTRKISLASAALVVLTIQMDAVGLVNRLASDDTLRAALVQKAYGQQQLNGMDPHQLLLLASRDLFAGVASPAEWWAQWRMASVPGLLISVLLLSLGAPFWFETLKNLLRLRTAIAGREEAQRAQRN